tara:strand:+ start:7033 stop:8793 length:1761 start_codon:yes stop_codon:yes gene_type:complete
MSKKIIAVVPMRHYSQRVPGKNYRTLGDRQLYRHIIDRLLSIDMIDSVVIETDSEIIIDGVKEFYGGSKIEVLERPQDLTAPEVSMNDILLSVAKRLNKIDNDTVIFQTHVTNPFLSVNTITNALKIYLEGNVNTLMSVTKYQKRLWGELGEPINHVPADLLQTQDLKPIFEENSSFYIFNISSLLKHNNRLGDTIGYYPMSSIESWDIDTEDDFEMAELILIKENKKIKNKKIKNKIENKLENELENENKDKKLMSLLNKELEKEISIVNTKSLKSKSRVLISAPYMIPQAHVFKKFYDELGINVIIADVNERLEESDLEKYAGMYDVCLCGDDRYTPKAIEKSGVKAICKWGTGIDSIDGDYCKSNNIPIYNTPNAFSVPVSQSIIAAILGFARTTFHSNWDMKDSDRWVKHQGYTLEELTIGVIGMGNIGRHLSHFLEPFRPTLLGYDINPDVSAIPRMEKMNSLDELLEKSDMVCCCCTLNPTSNYLINDKNILKMKRGSYLINMARGPLVEESALVTAITTGVIKGAALDVFEDEPLPVDSQLRKLPNVIISAHNSNSSKKYWNKVHVNTVRNSLKALSNL